MQKNWLFGFALFMIAAILMFMPNPLEAAPRMGSMRVAVLEFDVKGSAPVQDAGAIIPERLVTELNHLGTYDLVERVLLKKVLQEQALGLSGAIDDKTAAQIGRVYGVDGVIIGTVSRWGDSVLIDARLINTSSGSVMKTAGVSVSNPNNIPFFIGDLARQLGKSGEVSYVNKPKENQTFACKVYFEDNPYNRNTISYDAIKEIAQPILAKKFAIPRFTVVNMNETNLLIQETLGTLKGMNAVPGTMFIAVSKKLGYDYLLVLNYKFVDFEDKGNLDFKGKTTYVVEAKLINTNEEKVYEYLTTVEAVEHLDIFTAMLSGSSYSDSQILAERTGKKAVKMGIERVIVKFPAI